MSDSFVALWTVDHQTPLSMEFPKQEYWSGFPFPSPGDLSDLGIKLVLPALTGGFFTTEPLGNPLFVHYINTDKDRFTSVFLYSTILFYNVFFFFLIVLVMFSIVI